MVVVVVAMMVFCPRRPLRERQQPPRELEESGDFPPDSLSWEVVGMLSPLLMLPPLLQRSPSPPLPLSPPPPPILPPSLENWE